MSNTQKVVNFLTSTTSNQGMSEKQYNLFDSATDGLSYYQGSEDADISREDYFQGEVSSWDTERVQEFVEVFNL